MVAIPNPNPPCCMSEKRNSPCNKALGWICCHFNSALLRAPIMSTFLASSDGELMSLLKDTYTETLSSFSFLKN